MKAREIAKIIADALEARGLTPVRAADGGPAFHRFWQSDPEHGPFVIYLDQSPAGSTEVVPLRDVSITIDITSPRKP